jgi:hypothetical protein
VHAGSLARDEESLGDRTVAQTLSYEPKYLHLTYGEAGWPGRLQSLSALGDPRRSDGRWAIRWASRQVDARANRESLDATTQWHSAQPCSSLVSKQQGFRRFTPGAAGT